MDARYITPFITSVKNIFDTMIDLKVTVGKPRLKKDDISSYEISSIIGISGEVSGCVVLSLPVEIALKLASTLLDEELTEVDGDCTDAIGEISNMIAGDAKNDFPKTDTSVSVPTVVIGKHRLAYPSGVPIISIPCKTSGGELAIEVALKTP